MLGNESVSDAELEAPAILDATDDGSEVAGLRNIASQKLDESLLHEFVFEHVSVVIDQKKVSLSNFIAEFYQSGKTYAEFAKSKGISRETIRVMLWRYKLPSVRTFHETFASWCKNRPPSEQLEAA